MVVCRGVRHKLGGFRKVAGFLKKKKKGLVNLLLQRSRNIWKCCSNSVSPSNELTYLKYMAENIVLNLVFDLVTVETISLLNNLS